jgi:hypothetical protein
LQVRSSMIGHVFLCFDFSGPDLLAV